MKNDQELTYLYGLSRFGIKPGLATMERMMDALGHPERKFKSVHVTGTNGKGSTCAMIESILRAAGCKTALYTSPHLYAFNERIKIGGQSITDEMLGEYVAEIRAVCEKEDIQPTFFEFTTALAFLHFAKSDIDIAVVEVGMGGRHDATNVIVPLVSVITNVGLDHMEYLGSTKEEIAQEKAGIIKEGVPVVTAEEDENILDIFSTEAKEKRTEIIRVQEVVETRVISSGLDGQEVEIGLGEGEKFRVRLPLLGSHQVKNMATAIAAVLAFKREAITADAIIAGIENVRWEGRLQVVSQEPLIIVDGAHNADGVGVLRQFLTEQHLENRCGVLVLAVKQGKNIDDFLEHIAPLFHTVITTEGAYMPEKADVLAARIARISTGTHVLAEPDVRLAVELGKSCMKGQDMMLVTGSLYMIPEALKYFQGDDI